MKKITLLLFAVGIFTTFGFTVLQGGNTPVEGIDVIIKEAGIIAPNGTFKMDKKSLKELSALRDIERSVYLSKYLTPIFEKITREKGLEKVILKGLIETRCIECKSFEVFEFKVPSNQSKKEYSITLNTKFDTKWITVITDRENYEKPIANPHNFELISTVNELESKLKPEERKKIVQQFKKTDFLKLKNREEVFNTYIKYYKTPRVYVEEIVKFPPIKKKEISKKGKVLKKTKTIERQ
jgi:hypothetical protein